ncbi:MAG: exopolyphosphatase / guanosine-5'-triphosphate 3'-diphosphate [Rhodospirillaceae bacterium]|nr:MAG: exopolyphosphatase / guanosine-5'-triphosphate 3'-diphosphate [Rhodospirillaceae bacterium]
MKIKRRQEPVGIIDIGSNSIRLCVYDGAARVPVPLFNEKAVCALGQGMGKSGMLNPEGMEQAMAAVGRFVALSRAMEVERLDILATAAVRDAADGADFVGQLESRYHVEVKVLSGGQDDLGGGSLELVTVQNGDFGDHVTMPLGVLRLAEAAGDDRARADEVITKYLKKVPFLDQGQGRALYAVGGAWRAIARICISQTHHPLTVLDNFAIDPKEALRIIDLIAGQSKKSLEKVPGVSKKRVGNLPLAALLLDRVIRATNPSNLVFSIYGMREGQFYRRLPEGLRQQDPLLSVCRQMAQMNSRFPEHGDELMAWMAPLFPGETAHDARLRHAACLVSDIFWNEHPDYRAEQAFHRLLRLPFMGVPHRDRAAIAYTVYQRYQGDDDTAHAQMAIQLLDESDLKRCRVTGIALRLAHTLSGGAPNLLKRTRLLFDGDDVIIEVPGGNPAFAIENDRTFDKLAKALGCVNLVFRKV